VTVDLRLKQVQQTLSHGFPFDVKVGDFVVIYANEAPGTGYTWKTNNPDNTNGAPEYTVVSNSYLALPTAPSYLNGQTPMKVGGGSGTRTIFL
jgi:hypothetical protein